MMIEELKHNLAELIQKYQEANKDQAEADVRANYIDWLLFYLGWDVWGKDPAHTTRYQREGYIRGAQARAASAMRWKTAMADS